jgi:hypothetical protein
MPTSAELVSRSSAELSLRVGVQTVGTDGPKSLEQIGDEAEVAGSLGALKSFLAGVPEFSNNPPNHGHHAVSLLADEGLARVLSVNWDTCIERAAASLGRWTQPTISDQDRRNPNSDPQLHKLFGCVTRPESLRVTTAEITVPANWAAAEIASALATGSVVFIGLGTVPEQVRAIIEPVLADGEVADLIVVAPTLSAAWAAMELGPERLRAESGESFLDALLCGVMRRLFSDALAAAERQALTDTPSQATSDALTRLVNALKGLPAVPVAQWLRRGAGGLQTPARLLTDRISVDALTAVAIYAGEAEANPMARGQTATIQIRGAYAELAIWPGQPASRVVDLETRRVQELAAAGIYADAATTVVHFCSGHRGALPRDGAAVDIVDTPRPADIVAGPGSVRHRWIPIDGLLQGWYGEATEA